MAVTEQEVRLIVEEIVTQAISPKGESTAAGDTNIKSGQFSEMDGLIERADQAQRELLCMTLEKRKEIIRNIRQVILENMDALCKMAVDETKMGNIKDKHIKNSLAALKTPGVEDLEPVS